MPRLVRQSALSADDRIGIQGALVVVAVIGVVAGSLTLASRLDPLLRKLAPNPDERGHRPAVTSVQRPPPVVPQPETPAAHPQPQLQPQPRPESQPQRAPQRRAERQIASLPATLPEDLTPRQRPSTPETTQDETTEETPRTTNRSRESRRQVRRNVRNVRSRDVGREESRVAVGGATGLSSYALVSEARRYIGTNPTRMARLWCARFMNFVLKRSGYQGTGSDAALSFARYGSRVSRPRIGAIAVMRRKGGGHVGIVSGFDRRGNPILISGNTPNGRGGRIVAERVYPRGRIIAYVMPR